MSGDWYPIIDYEKCVSCMSCANFCPHDVYEVTDGKPVVKNPDKCVDLCKGCSKICDVKAIKFNGDADIFTKSN